MDVPGACDAVGGAQTPVRHGLVSVLDHVVADKAHPDAGERVVVVAKRDDGPREPLHTLDFPVEPGPLGDAEPPTGLPDSGQRDHRLGIALGPTAGQLLNAWDQLLQVGAEVLGEQPYRLVTWQRRLSEKPGGRCTHGG